MIGNRAEDVEKFIKKSLAALQLEYLDLYLIHAPVGLIGKHDLDVFPRDENGFIVLDMLTDLISLWKVHNPSMLTKHLLFYPFVVNFCDF